MLDELGLIVIPPDNIVQHMFAKDQSPLAVADRCEGFTLDTNISCNDEERIMLGISENYFNQGSPQAFEAAPPPISENTIVRQSSILKHSETYLPRDRTDSKG